MSSVRNTTIQVDEEVALEIRNRAESHWEPYNETLRRVLGMDLPGPTIGQGKGEPDDG